MLPCPSCHCHVLSEDPRCPHCGAELNLSSPPRPGVLALLVCALVGVSACTTDSGTEGEEGQTVTTQGGATEESQTETETETDSPPTSATVTTTGESGTETETGTLTFVPDNDISALYGICDAFAQDCPEGEKCVPYSSTGDGIYDARKCVIIGGDQQLGEPCTYSGVVDSTDDCGEHLFCYYAPGEQGGEGECVAFCEGTADDPVCAPGTSCVIAFEGSLTTCLQNCDPLLQDCVDERACHWTNADFACMPHEGRMAGEDCSEVAQCAPGLQCTAAELLPDCAGDACCTHFCDLSMPLCPTPGTECVSFFEEGRTPGENFVGVCLSPDAP